MRRLIASWAIVLLIAPAIASAHLVVDVRMAIDAPPFVTPGQSFTYHVVAEDVGYDAAYGIVVTITATGEANLGAITAKKWNCRTTATSAVQAESSTTITCSTEQIQPGPNAIDIAVTAPASPGTLQLSAQVQTIGSFDPNRDNDSAAAKTMVYNPASCQAPPPAIVTPADTADVSGSVRLAWSAVQGATQYAVLARTEGAATAAIAQTASTTATIVADPGQTEWWIEARFAACPSVVSEHRRFTATSLIPPKIAVYAGQTEIAATNDGPVASATFRAPYGLAFSPDQRQLFVTDEADSDLRVITNGSVATIAGTPGIAGSTDGQSTQFHNLRGVTVTALDNYIYVADTLNDEIRFGVFSGSGSAPFFPVAGAPQLPGYVDDIGDKARVNAPSGVAGTERGLLFVADTANHAIRELTPVPISGIAGLFNVSTIGGIGGQAGSNDGAAGTSRFRAPEGIAADAAGAVYVADTGNHTIRIIANGNVTTLAGEAGIAGSSDGRGSAAHFNAPVALALDDRGNLYVCDRDNHAVRRVAPSGLVTTIAAGLQKPTGIAVDHAGNVYAADAAAHVIFILKRGIPSQPSRHRTVAH